ncbi:hypothetical protein M2360_001986 [Rhizobium sp. SG_E_25_P2]|uniref:hypothetical protein n=1 Tax=Rhizobium sp. SG_E_25_P2 TaxID=2879942 RepID=UPI0024767444|nr:hypothetical protein [Rhizobium sp. SG_E_25_P2]MDH6266590.1 hypothetical protein [Rhizobium sp. SG_E_25_P2]
MFVLHVGPHKTATTWLQHNFHANARALEGAGWFYPQTGERVRVAHHDLSDNAAEILDDASEKVAEIRRIAEKARVAGLSLLLSSEGFRNWKPAEIARLRDLVGQEMRIVYCLRDPASLLYSFWAQQIKTGQKLSFPAFRNRHFKARMKSRILNPLVEVEALAGIAGTSLTLLVYDEIRRRNLDIFDVFTTEILDLPPLPHVDETSTANERLPLELAEFMRLMLIQAGDWRSFSDVNIGRMFRHFLADDVCREIVDTVRAVPGAGASIKIPRKRPLFRQVEKRLLRRHRARLIPAPGSEQLFLDGVQICDFYREKRLLADPAVAALLDRMSHLFRPKGPRVLLANLSRGALIGWRRLLKRLRG